MQTITHQISDTDKIWIYQSSRKLNDQEVALIEEAGSNFVAKWAAHGQKLYASISVLHGYFIVIALDEIQAGASGCSIDLSIIWIKGLEKELNIDLLDRQTIAWMDENQQIRTSPLAEFESLAANHQIEEDVLVFNNLVFNGKDFKQGWIIPARESWHSRYFTLV